MKAVAGKEASWTTCSTFSYSVKKSSGSHMSTLPSVSKIYRILVTAVHALLNTDTSELAHFNVCIYSLCNILSYCMSCGLY